MRFRWFSASQLRFISPDLLLFLNRYSYVSGNPITYIDFFGLKETAEGETGTIIWEDPYEYPWYKKGEKWDEAKEYIPNDEELRNLIKIIKVAIKQYHDDEASKRKNTMPPDYKVIMCHDWRGRFVNNPRTGQWITGIRERKNICVIEKSISVAIKRKFDKILYPNIFAFASEIQNKHSYTYLRVVFPNNKEVWLLTETNASGHERNADIDYRTIVVPPPTSYPGKPPGPVESVIDYFIDQTGPIYEYIKKK